MYHIKEKVKISGEKMMERIMNNVIWGNSDFNPNKKEKDRKQEVIDYANMITQHQD